MDEDGLLSFVLICVSLSLVSFGGGQAIMAELQYQTTVAHDWLTPKEFTDLFAISKVAPGPGTQIVALIGWQIAGLAGAIAAAFAIFVPSSVLLGVVGVYWERARPTRLRWAIEQGLLPVAAGLMLAGIYSIGRAAGLGIVDLLTVCGTLVLLQFTKVGAYPILISATFIYIALAAMNL